MPTFQGHCINKSIFSCKPLTPRLAWTLGSVKESQAPVPTAVSCIPKPSLLAAIEGAHISAGPFAAAEPALTIVSVPLSETCRAAAVGVLGCAWETSRRSWLPYPEGGCSGRDLVGG